MDNSMETTAKDGPEAPSIQARCICASSAREPVYTTSSDGKRSPPSADVLYLPSMAAHTIPHHRPRRHCVTSLSQQDTTELGLNSTANSTSVRVKTRHAKLDAQVTATKAQIMSARADLSSAIYQLRSTMLSTNASATSSPRDAVTSKRHSSDQRVPGTDQQTLVHAQTLVRRHIALLHRYNEIKDIGSGLMGLIADKDGRRLGDVMVEFGIEEGD